MTGAPKMRTMSLIDELENVVAHRNIGSRADVLRKVTDLFVAGCDRFDDEGDHDHCGDAIGGAGEVEVG